MRSRDCILPGILLALITRRSKAFRQRPSHNSVLFCTWRIAVALPNPVTLGRLYPTMPQLKSLSTSPSDPVAEVEEWQPAV